MLDADERQHADVGGRQRRQCRHLPDRVRTHLDDREAMLGSQAEQHQRHTDEVVQIALRLVHRAGRDEPEQRADRAACRRLARRAGDGDDSPRKAPAVRRGDGAERAQAGADS